MFINRSHRPALRLVKPQPRTRSSGPASVPSERLQTYPGPYTVPEIRKLQVGCGPCIAPGWVNCDVKPLPGVDLCADLRAGLPLPSGSVDCIAAIHVLQDLNYLEVRPALAELRRILRIGGVLRLGLPDLDKAICAYLANDPSYFYVPDADARSIGAKLVTQLTWYGSVQTPFTYDCIREWLLEAGFASVYRCEYQVTLSRFADLATLDNRERESLFVEAVK